MTIQELETTLRKEKIFEAFGLTRPGLLGSFARGKKYHNIDILLEQHMDYKLREKLKHKLQIILKAEIDLVPQKFADPLSSIVHKKI